MKYLTVIAVLFLTLTSCKNNTQPEVKTVAVGETAQAKTIDENATYAKAEFTIEGMTCAIGCAKTIEKKLGKMEGVKSAQVDFDKKLATVEYNEKTTTTEYLEKTVSSVGDMYKVIDMKMVE